jgi:RNA polymerase sigma-70 factor (ECF subfamily)
MATYNKSLIFKYAWRLFKGQSERTEAKFNSSLRMAWHVAKTNPTNLEETKVVAKAKPVVVVVKPTITELYNTHYSSILGFITRSIYNSDDAEELASDTFINANKGLKGFDSSKSNAKTWLRTIAKNLIVDYSRSKRYKDKLAEDNVSEYTDENGNELFSFTSDNNTAQTIESNELQNVINKAFANLKPKYKRIADLYFIEQYSYAEIIEMCDVPEGTVKGMISRCKEMLQSQLQGESMMLGIGVGN